MYSGSKEQVGTQCTLGLKRNKFTVAENHEFKETDSLDSVQSSLKFEVINPVH